MKHFYQNSANENNKGKTIEAIVYPILLLIIMWIVFFIDRFYHLELYRYGIKPHTFEGLKGILFMPLIHSQDGFSHIASNSLPTAVLLGTLIYFYREIALRVFLIVWLGTGILLWNFAFNDGAYHIGMSGVIYGLFGFLLLSGFIRKFLPLQAISLCVAFIYGSLIWGILPMKGPISWEGHFSGLLIGILLAFAFRKKGPLPPKYNYEIEEEMGIYPPDLEELQEEEAILSPKKEEEKDTLPKENKTGNTVKIKYHYIPKPKKDKEE